MIITILVTIYIERTFSTTKSKELEVYAWTYSNVIVPEEKAIKEPRHCTQG